MVWRWLVCGNSFLRVGGAKILEPTRVSRIWRVSTIECPLAFIFNVRKRKTLSLPLPGLF